MNNKIFNELKNKKVLILGFGKEGKSTYHFIRKNDPNMKIGISDIKEITDCDALQDNNVILYSGSDYLKCCSGYDVIIKGPGVIIKDYVSEDIKKKITCQTDLFLKFSSNITIGITGTKGKSTTSSLLYHILKSLNQSCILMGNIGIPVFDVLDDIEEDTICILELGVHQLEFMKHSPNIAVILNIYEEHLDHYISMQKYVNAKKNIYLHQKENDIFLVPNSIYLNNSESTNGILYKNEIRKKNYYLLEENKLIINANHKEIKIPKDKIKTNLKGEHNLYNILVCLTIMVILNMDLEKSILAIKSFNGLPHRLEYIGTYQDILFYDDAIATSIPSVISAIETLREVDTIIIGGMDRGIDYQPLSSYLEESSVQNVILLPDTNQRIEKLFVETDKNIISVPSMEEAVKISKKMTQKGKICLLSPAAASYNQYQNFEEKGNHFKRLVGK